MRRGLGLARVWSRGRDPRAAGRPRVPGYRRRRDLYPPPAVCAVRVAGARRLRQLQQPLLIALAVAHGRPRRASGLSPGSPLARGSPWPARPQVEREAASAPAASPRRQPRPRGLSPAYSGFPPRPGSSSLPPAARIQGEALSKAAPVPEDPALGLESLTLALIKSWPITG